MYFQKIIERANRINWSELELSPKSGGVRSEDFGIGNEYGFEFLRRLACFYKEQKITPRKPMISNIAELLGDKEKCKIIDYLNEGNKEIVLQNSSLYSSYFLTPLSHYLQLARYVDQYPEYAKYLDVYDPLLQVVEQGKTFLLRWNDLRIVNCPEFLLEEWYDMFVMANPQELT